MDDRSPDRLTIGRLLLFVAGIAVGLALFAPSAANGDEISPAEVEWWRYVAGALLIGLSLPAPLICVPRALRNARLGAGGLFALTAGLGVWLFLPIVFLARVRPPPPSGDAVMCLNYVLPLMGLWYLLAAVVGGHVGRRFFRSEMTWTERYGLVLALLWSPLGVWIMVDFYRDALK